MTDNAENINRLLSLKTGEKIWSCNIFPVFSMSDGYFGHYMWGDDYSPWEIHCIEGKSPTVFKPIELFYEGRFDAVGSSGNKLFVFSTSLCPTSFGNERFVLSLYHEGYKPPELKIDAKVFDHLIPDKQLLSFDRVHFTEEECLEKCRDLNSNWHSSSGIGAYGKWYMKTLNKMKKELAECMKAEWVVDPEKQLEKDIYQNIG